MEKYFTAVLLIFVGLVLSFGGILNWNTIDKWSPMAKHTINTFGRTAYRIFLVIIGCSIITVEILALISN